ncbi:WecB/TagA/CpsF family glycosyltransferase [Nonomuraea soli]|uniref:N-acetylglucosaminyldiphosphoundecaprenol N-acetyl-beta-D-mannosaminyltransferase n=1 Tax=Nonomuraea soli TaxID=1032476 RepID=A0A7W0CV71_9ACTN|nr:WecB/TagA/CpsF family glycosyltransferase [Nonomuraea soli]MBA2897951.1 N-acetylglucosaminyldiphosphoundecaprenol N-acetyl-beta-D-mannosaminyltransferase [Nonomuraea soli]
MTLRSEVLDARIDPLTMDEVIRRCVDAIALRRPLTIGVVNAAKLVNMRADALLRESVETCELVLADGQAVVWASRVLGAKLPERVAGVDLFMELLAEGDRRGYRAFFLGATQEVLDRMTAEIGHRFPGLVIAGARNGYFDDAQSGQVAQEIRDSGADLLFLGMTSPKKEIFVREWGGHTGAMVVHGVGGSFDILSGQTKRAPLSWQRLGLEWFYRLIQEPVRLGPRYLKTNARFILMIAQQRMGRTK